MRRPAQQQPDEVTRALSRFLVVRTCGFLERTIVECCGAFLTSKAVPRVAAYGVSWVSQRGNPKPERLVDLVRRFDSEWGDELESLLDEDDGYVRRELSFLVDRRNKIAHGESEGISASKALALLEPVRRLADWFVLRLDPR